MLLLALLTAQTAWADGISYLDATGQTLNNSDIS
jgi:hypothetical protein